MNSFRQLGRRLWRQIIWRLLASYLLVGLAAIALLGAFVLAFAGHYFDEQARAGVSDFRLEVLRGLLVAGLAAVLASAAVSLFVSRRILQPLRLIMGASRHIASGHYDERVPVRDDFEITQLAASFNQMADALERTEERRRALIADVAHELRTPLTSIKGYMEALMDGVVPGDEATYAQIYKEADRLYRLVEDLQELSRLEAGEALLQLRQIDIGELLEAIAVRVRPQYEAKHVRLVVGSVPDLRPVWGDEDRLCQALMNLLSNGLLYTATGGTVEVTGYAERDRVCVAVRDTGIGIAPEHFGHIFGRFYRVDKSRSRSGGGTGIGLTIAKQLVEMHGGTIAVTSTVGVGSTFTIALPMQAVPERAGNAAINSTALPV